MQLAAAANAERGSGIGVGSPGFRTSLVHASTIGGGILRWHHGESSGVDVRVSGHPSLTILLACLAILGAFAAALVRPAQGFADRPIKLGVYVASLGQTGAPEDAQVLDNYAAMVGRKPDLVMTYSNLTQPLLTPVEISNLRARAETPIITWQLFQQGWSGQVISLQDIAAGSYDSYIRQAADLARSLPFKVMIRFAHEMNGPWEPWGPGQAGNVGTAYVDAWRHVVSIFRQESAGNVKWVWSPNVDNGDYPFASYFPGDSWVDYVALDGYNWGTAGVGTNAWQSLSEVFSSSYKTLTRMSARPVMITETSSSEIGGNKAAWIRHGFLRTIPKQFPRIRAVIWFNRNQEEDWRIESSAASLHAYRCVADSPIYGGHGALPPSSCPVSKQKSAIKSLRVTRRVRVSPRGVVSGRGRGRASMRGSVRYRLSRRAGVKITVRSRSGRKFALTRNSSPRKGAVRLSKVVGPHRLRRGRYSVIASAIDDRGQASKPRRARFRAV
jgi:hypothetical protein